MSKNALETTALYVERDTDRRIRHRNKLYYRFNHWPIWIFVFFIAPGPLTFDLFERGFDARSIAWLALVLIGTGIAGPVRPAAGLRAGAYIIRFTEDRPNPLYRRICYTTAWGEVDCVRRAEHRGPGLGGRHRRVAAEADVHEWAISRSPARCGCWAPWASCRA